MTSETKKTGFCGYHPEMGEKRPDVQIDAQLSHTGRHYFLKSATELSGRGVTYLGTLESKDLTPAAQHKAGWHQYKVTMAAFDRICKAHAVGVEMLLS